MYSARRCGAILLSSFVLLSVTGLAGACTIELDIDGVSDADEVNVGGFVGIEGDWLALQLERQPPDLNEGTVTLTLDDAGADGEIKIYEGAEVIIRNDGENSDLSEPWDAEDMPAELYVEGIKGSTSPRDLTLTLSWTMAGQGDTVTLTVVKVEKLQYQSDSDFVDISGTLYVLRGTSVTFKAIKAPSNASWPSGKPVWGGTAGASGTGETKSVTFSTLSSSKTDYKTVTAECGNTVTANVIVYELTGVLTPDDNFTGRSQSNYGLEETVDLTFTTDPTGITATQAGGLEWRKWNGVGQVSNAGNDGTADYDAKETAGGVTFRLAIKSGPSKDDYKSYSKTVIAPTGTRMTRVSTNVSHIQGSASAGIALYYWLDPKTVSFTNLTFGEDSCPSTNVSGFYLTCDPWNSYPNGSQIAGHSQNTFGDILDGNSTNGCRVQQEDRALTGDANPYAAGSFTWSIPTQYIDDTSARNTFGSNQNQVSTFQANGYATQSKGGQSGSAALNDPTSGW